MKPMKRLMDNCFKQNYQASPALDNNRNAVLQDFILTFRNIQFDY